MATATITETLELPSGAVTDLTAARVRLRLVADSDGAPAPGYVTGDNATVVADKWTNPNSSGTYTFTGVRPNSGSSDDAITSPTGTVYQIAIFLKGQSAVHRYISVPDSAGPHQVADILTVAPDPLPTGQDLLDLIDAAGLDLTDLPNGVTADAVIGLDGGALVELTPAQVMATHTGDTSDAHDAAAISYAGGTGMSATDVEAAIDELANEKANLAGAAFTGAVTVTGADLTVTGAGGGSLHLDTNPSDDAATLAIYGSGDTQPRIAVGFSVFDVPAINMGPGGATAADVTLYRSAAGVVNANGGGFAGIGKGLVLTEQSAPTAPAANDIVLYAADDGGGTTVLRTKDSAGTVTTLGSGGGGLTAEDVRDTIGTALVEGEAIDITVNDGADTISIAAEDASDTNKGVVELATPAEMKASISSTLVPPVSAVAPLTTPAYATAAGTYLAPPYGATSVLGLLTATGRMLMCPVWVGTQSLDRIGIRTTASGTLTMRLGFYPMSSTGAPLWASVVDCGTVDCSVTAGLLEIAISQTPSTPWVWAACLVDAFTSGATYYHYGSTATAHPANVHGLGEASIGTSTAVALYYQGVATGALPTSDPGSAGRSSLMPRISFRKA